MLDTTSLRVAFAVAALTMLVLFYFVNYRSTRSSYSGWWCVALIFFLTGSLGYVLNGTGHQWWANPLANGLTVMGQVCVWASARSLRTDSPRARWLPWLPAALVAVSLLDDPARNVWSGGPFFLGLMSAMIGLAALELRWHQTRYAPEARTQETHSRFVDVVAVAAAMCSLFYLGRLVAFLMVGPDDPLFSTWFGGQVTTLITTGLLVVVCFSMSSLSNAQQTAELRVQATHDGLTGLLNRTEFLRRAEGELRRAHDVGASAELILADLDHFKQINDTFGHAAGDAALRAFAAACQASVRPADLVGRFGGEEFILLLPRASSERAEQVTAQISQRLRAAQSPGGPPMPTVSYGIASALDHTDVQATIASADAALYRAKEFGRDRAIRAHEQPAARRPATTD